MCFECGEPWHTGSCKNGVDSNLANFLLLANCPKCKAPVEKNGACNMMSCRCGTGFCWICRQDTGHNYDHFRFRKLSWHLGCSRLIGDTALGQCIHMIIELFLLPIIVIPEAQYLLFYKYMHRYFENFDMVAPSCFHRREAFLGAMGFFGLATLCLPLTVCIVIILTPLMFITRLHQLMGMLFKNCCGYCWTRLIQTLCCCLNR